MIGFEARALKTYIFKTFPKKIGKINFVALAQKLAIELFLNDRF